MEARKRKSRDKVSRFFGHRATARVIFKGGDDMRQDQLVVQMVNLIDRLWKRVNLDLRLTPFRVLSTSRNTGE